MSESLGLRYPLSFTLQVSCKSSYGLEYNEEETEKIILPLTSIFNLLTPSSYLLYQVSKSFLALSWSLIMSSLQRYVSVSSLCQSHCIYRCIVIIIIIIIIIITIITITITTLIISSSFHIFLFQERKGISDLFQSFASGRLYNQAESMGQHYEHPCLLIEFHPDKSFNLQVSVMYCAALCCAVLSCVIPSSLLPSSLPASLLPTFTALSLSLSPLHLPSLLSLIPSLFRALLPLIHPTIIPAFTGSGRCRS